MKSIERIDKERGGARAGQCSCYFGTDVSRLAHAGHDEASLAVMNEFYCLVEIVVEQRYQVEDGLCLVSHTFNGIIFYLAHSSDSITVSSWVVFIMLGPSLSALSG